MLKYQPHKSDIGHLDQILVFLLASRTAESSSKETQKDMHCENGRDEEPVEEYRCAVRQLVSVFLMYKYLLLGHLCVRVIMCVGSIRKPRERKKGVCLYDCVG